MIGFGNVISEILIQINHDVFRKRKNLQNNLVCVLKNEKKVSKDVIPQSLIRSRAQMIDLIDCILYILNLKFTDEEIKLLADEEKEKISTLGIRISENCHPDKEKTEFLIMLVTDIIYLTRRPMSDFPHIIAKLFGTPIQSILRQSNLVKGKTTKQELDHAFRHKINFSIAPLMDKLLELKRIDKNEFEQIKDLMTLLQAAYFTFCINNKEITKKDIERCISDMKKAGIITPSQEAELQIELSAKEIAVCKISGKTFVKNRRTQKYCEEFSNSPEYQKFKRKGLHK